MNTKSAMQVEASRLFKTYNEGTDAEVCAVKEVTLKVRSGEILLISGPNGGGKTTLLSMLGCLARPTSGDIRIMGQGLNSLHRRDLPGFRLRNIGFIFQTFRLLDSLTALENVELVLNLAGMKRPESTQKAEALLDELVIWPRRNSFQKTLSGGEKQRVAIARALANDPPLILADEPTGSLDSQTGQQVMYLLNGIARKKNKTVIIVSHDRRIRHYVDRILHMEDGKLDEEGKSDRVFQHH